MPSIEHVLRVFVGSPSDVKEEREQLEKVITELNRIWSRNLGLRLELIRWETHVTPGFGDYPQDVINRQVKDDYDIFIGIFWSRVGTPTPYYESGSIEELERALEVYKKHPAKMAMLVYFKDAPIPPSQIDVVQLSKVQELKSNLREVGCLYWEFKELSDFATAINAHLSRVSQDWHERIKSQSIHVGELLPKETNMLPDDGELEKNEDEDLGFLDYIEISTKGLGELTQITALISNKTQDLNSDIRARAKELEEIGRIRNNSDFSQARRVVKRSADDMEHYATFVSKRLPLFVDAYREAFNAASRALALYAADFKDADDEGIDELYMIMSNLETSILGAGQSVSNMQEAVSRLPRISVSFNKAKKSTVKALTAMKLELDNAANLLGTVLKAMK